MGSISTPLEVLQTPQNKRFGEGIVPQSLLANYEGCGFSLTHSELGKRALPFGKNPLLLVVDVCAAYLTPGTSLYAPERFDAALKHVESLITLFRLYDLPIIFTKTVHYNVADRGTWNQKAEAAIRNFDEGSAMGDFPATSTICRPDPKRPREFLVIKQYASAFFGTSLASTLTAMRIDTPVLCGFTTSGCIRATGVDALQNGFSPYVVGEACGDRHEWPNEASLFDLQAKYAEVVSMEEIENLLRTDS